MSGLRDYRRAYEDGRLIARFYDNRARAAMSWRTCLAVTLLALAWLVICQVSAAGQRGAERLRVVCTAYCPCAMCTDGDGKTATGRDARLAGVAVDPAVIPLGARLDIPGYSRGKGVNGSWIRADDVGGKIKGMAIDVRMETHEDAVLWGRKNLTVRVWR